MGARTRRQHVVSNFYLKAFADSSQRLQQVNLPGDHVACVSTSDASVAKDFYTLELSDGTETDAIEQAFGVIESPAAAALTQLLEEGFPLSAAVREAWASWCALQYLRSPSVRAAQTQINAEFIRLIVGASGKEQLRQHIEAAEGMPLSDVNLEIEWRDLTREGGPNIQDDKLQHVVTIMDLLPGLTVRMMRSAWSLITFDRRCLAVSDHPVVLIARRDHPPFMGLGIANAAGCVVPLSRNRCLYMHFDDESGADVTIPGTTVLWREIVERQIESARRFIYHHPEDSLADFELGSPRNREIGPVGSHLIAAEGLFSNLTDSERRSMSESQARIDRAMGVDKSDGISLTNVAWPIPGRHPPLRMP